MAPYCCGAATNEFLRPSPVAAGHRALGAIADDAVWGTVSEFVNIEGAKILCEAPGEPRVLAGASMQRVTFLSDKARSKNSRLSILPLKPSSAEPIGLIARAARRSLSKGEAAPSRTARA